MQGSQDPESHRAKENEKDQQCPSVLLEAVSAVDHNELCSGR